MKLLTLRKLHRWMALLVGAQVLVWTLSGVVFAWLDQGSIAGDGLADTRSSGPPGRDETVVEPAALGLLTPEVASLALQPVNGHWVYRIGTRDGVELRLASDGSPYRIDAAVARALATASYRGRGRLATVRSHPGPTSETRGAGPTWEARFDDDAGTTLYFSAADGALVATRTDAWRLKDFFWMLHTMDYRGRDDFNHPLIVVAGAAALWVAGTGLWLLLRVFGRRNTAV